MTRTTTRRMLIATAAAGALLISSACGDDEGQVGGGTGGAPATDPGPETTIDYPTDPTHVVITYEGMLIAGDGRVFEDAYSPFGPYPDPAENGTDSDSIEDAADTAPAAFDAPARPVIPTPTLDLPPPRPVPLMVTQISPEGMQMLLGEAERLGLFDADTEPDAHDMWPRPVTIDLGSSTHTRIAGGLADYDDPEATQFAARLGDLPGFLGDEIGPTEPYVPHAWSITTSWGAEGQPVLDWQLDTEPSNGDCLVLPSATDEDTATGTYEHLDDSGVSVGGTYDALPAYPWECTDIAPGTPPVPGAGTVSGHGTGQTGSFDQPTESPGAPLGVHRHH